MGQAAQQLSSVLERERQAAVTADVDALAQIQIEKRSALDAMLQEGDVSEEEMSAIRARALANVQLIRHLTVCLQGMVSPPASTYTAGGSRSMGGVTRSWGRL